MGGPAQLIVQEAGAERAGWFNALALVQVRLALPSTPRLSLTGAVNLCNKEPVALLSSLLSVRDQDRVQTAVSNILLCSPCQLLFLTL